MNEKLDLTSDEHIICRVRGEYLEMPGLRLTQKQAQRLWGLDSASCAQVLEALTETHFLCRRQDGTYARASGDEAFRFRRPA